jgi:trimeric autotransporter adhesin
LDTAGLNSLIQQVQGYQQLGASFDGAQAGIFGARFDNELLSGTLKADTTTALQALQDILNNGGTVSATDAAQLTAAGFGYVADAQDVSGNNAPNGGGTYIGTSTTVAGATTTQIADANTTTSGNVNGNEQPTNHPVNGLANNGFGVTYSAASSGQGAGAGGGGTGGNRAADGGGGVADAASAGAGHSGGQGSSHIDGDIAALLQALQQNNTNAVNTAVTALGNDVQVAPGAAGGGIPHFSQFISTTYGPDLATSPTWP